MITIGLEAFDAKVAELNLSERDKRFFASVRRFVKLQPELPAEPHIGGMIQAAMYRLVQGGDGVTFSVLMNATDMAKLWGFTDDQCAKAFVQGARRAGREAFRASL